MSAMARLPFDPDKLSGPAPARKARRERAREGEGGRKGGKGGRDAEPIAVCEAAAMIKRALSDHTPTPLRVVGEVSNFNERGHWYFSLKDEEAVLNCVMWRSAAAKVGFTPERGQEVVATGRLDYYGPQGKVQLYADRLEPVGQGALELRFRRLCDELREAGYFEPGRKRPIPAFPRRIAVVTSERGAALQDVIRTARQRWAGCRLTLVNVRVQGAASAPEVAGAIDALSAHHERLGVDAVLVTRGGGSLEDLWAFNERIVADAVYRSAVPVVAAIGHEVDTTIAELVADLRCSTPTQAAERLVPDARAERQRVASMGDRLAVALRRRAEAARASLRGVERHELFRRPRAVVEKHADRLGRLADRLGTAARGALESAGRRLGHAERALARLEPRGRLRYAEQQVDHAADRLDRAIRAGQARRCERLEALERQLRAVGPRNVLERGYSYTTDAEGRLIRSAREVRAGQSIETHLADGKVASRVQGEGKGEGEGEGEASTPGPGTSKPRRRKRASDDQQPELFG